MTQKKSFFDRVVKFLGLLVCGVICAYAAVLLGGLELLLAGVVITLFCDGSLTIWLRRKWLGMFIHLIWAGVFFAMVYQTREIDVDTVSWQWYALWGLLGLRVFVLQIIYLVVLRKK